jgi:hypothetical protein
MSIVLKIQKIIYIWLEEMQRKRGRRRVVMSCKKKKEEEEESCCTRVAVCFIKLIF